MIRIKTDKQNLLFFSFCFLFSFLLLSDVRAEQVEPEKKDAVETEENLEKKKDVPLLVKRNPFLFPEEEDRKECRKVIIDSSLSAIFVSASGRSYAIIDGRIVKQGDTFLGKEIVKISDEEVELNDINGRYVIYLGKK